MKPKIWEDLDAIVARAGVELRMDVELRMEACRRFLRLAAKDTASEFRLNQATARAPLTEDWYGDDTADEGALMGPSPDLALGKPEVLKAALEWHLYRRALHACPTERAFLKKLEEAELRLERALDNAEIIQ